MSLVNGYAEFWLYEYYLLVKGRELAVFAPRGQAGCLRHGIVEMHPASDLPLCIADFMERYLASKKWRVGYGNERTPARALTAAIRESLIFARELPVGECCCEITCPKLN